jgi:hypothetical protein
MYRSRAAEAGDGLIEGANKLQAFGEHLQQHDEDPEDTTGLGEVIATMDPPPEGMVYRLQMQEDGSIAIVCVEDTGEDMSTHDRTYRHRISDGVDPVLKRMNLIARRRSSRTRDWNSTQPTTLFRHKALTPGQRLEMQGPNSYGTYDLVLFGRTFDLTGPVPMGSGSGQSDNPGTGFPAQNWAASPGSRPGERSIRELDSVISNRTGDHAMTESQRLRSMNRAAAEFWRRSA